ncbi:MAG: hypothetical protein KatS3mg115_0936 [Candidatus Poribacteria bacterium]|nr:MAG: hypothetical protein KatS3mg115_0936 [Candidatus Poribacteria bacterium]
MLRALRKAFPEAVLFAHVRPLVAPMMVRHPDLDAVIVSRRAEGRRWRNFWVERGALQAGRFDWGVLAHPTSVAGAMLLWLAGIPRRVGHRIFGREPFLTDRLPLPGKVHEVERYLSLLEPLGVRLEGVERALYFWHGPEERRFADELLQGVPRPLVGLHLGTTWPSKRWSLDRFVQLAERLLKRGAGLLLIGGAPEASARDAFLKALPGTPILDAVGRTDLFQSAALIERCDLFRPQSTPVRCIWPPRSGRRRWPSLGRPTHNDTVRGERITAWCGALCRAPPVTGGPALSRVRSIAVVWRCSRQRRSRRRSLRRLKPFV